ncbi:flavodoxin family protein [Clostridium estertheticum]|uniref:flavodoxin family protein n=1 Tax=Clostridium estertheticum TaxID=238834 RepID=UPI001C6F30A5|nr:flavodoxin family protein [Clostridium estertheticum]MBW9170936.1 flavodoxin family protein [Clostridium estertheticum]WLC74230.1 flavodoxin family protein [Clostridium estertheticum]
MNIVVISGSPRKGGNTEIMAETFAKGARESGHEVTIKMLSELKVAPCVACNYCFTSEGVCSQKDDMTGILEVVDKADMLVFASPIYWFDITAQLKCTIDRMYARGKIGFHHKYVGLLLNSGAPAVYDAAIAQYKASNSYLKWEDKGIITIAGMEKKGSMDYAEKLHEVFEFGKSIK